MKENNEDLVKFLSKLLPEGLPTDATPESRRRLEIIVRTHLGQSQSEICRAVGCSKETARYWMNIGKTEAVGTWNESSLGRPKLVNDLYLKRLEKLVSSSPQEYGYDLKHWTARCLSQHLAQELGIVISDRHVNRLLKEMGLSTRGKATTKRQNSILSNKKTKIVIEDLNPHLLSQSDDLIWRISQHK